MAVSKVTQDSDAVRLARAQAARATSALKESRIHDAERGFQAVIREVPTLGAGHFGLGVLRLAQHRHEEARELLAEAVQTTPNPPACYVEQLERATRECDMAASALSRYDEQSAAPRSGVIARARRGVVGIRSIEGSQCGSGVILSVDGLVGTNAHVVTGGEMLVISPDGGRNRAVVLGVDKTADLAVLRVEGAEGFVPLRFVVEGDVTVGEQVLAIGNGLGIDDAKPTVSAGIVSAVRHGSEFPNLTAKTLIQTDAAFNKGNSGGALINSSGRLIGIPTGSVEGGVNIGLAIPIWLAAPRFRALASAQSESSHSPRPSQRDVDAGPRPGRIAESGDDDGPGKFVQTHRLPLRVLAVWMVPAIMLLVLPDDGSGVPAALGVGVYVTAFWWRRRIRQYERMLEVTRGVVFRRLRPVWLYQLVAPPRLRENLLIHTIFGVRKIIITVSNPSKKSTFFSASSSYSLTVGVRTGNRLYEQLLIRQRAEREKARGIWFTD